jgi:hypothetical protein
MHHDTRRLVTLLPGDPGSKQRIAETSSPRYRPGFELPRFSGHLDAAPAAVCDKYGIAELPLFGSRARGTARPDSDVDVVYSLRMDARK